MASSEHDDPRRRLTEILADRPDLASSAVAIFDYSQYLLDDDERLTKGGALDGVGRDLLRQRALEALGGPAPATDDEVVDDTDEDSDDSDDSDDGADAEDEE